MSLIVNGITIPTNVANVLKVNGTSVTSVIVNTTQVWIQSLVTALIAGWSGSSLASTIGIQTSGFNYRSVAFNQYIGPWQTVSNIGIFSGSSFFQSTSGIETSGNLLRYSGGGGTESGWVTLASNGTFIGSSTLNYPGGGCSGSWNIYTETTAGGYMRFNDSFGQYGQWIRIN
jgi:hypothetical protein